jgi:predicted nucleic acid-binding protein
MKVIVCDAGPLIHLGEADCLDLLRPAGTLFLPHRVAVEVRSAVSVAEPWPTFLQIVKLEPHERKQADMWQTAGDLHAGEAEALVLARRKKADWFLTDDATTRLFVSLLGLEVHGSLGIILWNAAKGFSGRDEAESALERLEATSLWLSDGIRREARQALEEIMSMRGAGRS